MIDNSQKLLNLFDLDAEERKTVIYFSKDSGSIGFSYKLPYPKESGFIPSKTSIGEDDDVILVRVGYYHSQVINNKAPIHFSIGKLSKYLSDKFRYDFSDSKSPTKESVDRSNNSIQPIDIVDSDHFLNIENGKIYNNKNKEIKNPREFLRSLIEKHINTTTIKGALLRWRIARNNVRIERYERDIRFLKWALKMFFGRKFREKDSAMRGFIEPYLVEQLEIIDPGKEISFSGLSLGISKRSFSVVLILIVLSSIINFYLDCDLLFFQMLNYYKDNVFILASFFFSGFVLYDYLGTKLGFLGVNYFINQRRKSYNKKFKV